jgi:hypothetical protein
MPNQYNFRSDITTNTNPRFLASRIVKIPEELILYEEIPASFAYDADDNIELHFYVIPSNELLLSALVKLGDGIVKTHLVEYVDRTYKNYVRIDFTKLFLDKNLILVPGDYKVSINFFSDEIGAYDNKILNIDAISESRTEVQLSFNNTVDQVSIEENNRLAKEFVEKSFNKVDAIGAAQKIFKSGVELNDPTEGVTATTVIQNVEVVDGQTYENTVGRIDKIQAREQFEKDLNDFIVDLYKTIVEEIVIINDERIQEDEYQSFIQAVVDKKLESFRKTVDTRIQVS